MFAVPLGVLLALQIQWWLAALFAAVIGLCLSYIFLRKPRESVARDLYAARHPVAEPVHPDAESEDEALDRFDLARHEQGGRSGQGDPLEREGQPEQQPVAERGQAGELQGEDKLP